MALRPAVSDLQRLKRILPLPADPVVVAADVVIVDYAWADVVNRLWPFPAEVRLRLVGARRLLRLRHCERRKARQQYWKTLAMSPPPPCHYWERQIGLDGDGLDLV